MLVVNKISKRWPNRDVALSEITFSGRPGTLTALIGPSGSGKSTLLRVIADLDSYDTGMIDNSHGEVGMVFQQPSLWPHLTLIENVTLPLRVLKGMAQDQARGIAEEVLNAWGLKVRLDAYPSELSGGEQQRGALARTLVMKPKVLCLDEVTSSLDPEITADILTRLVTLKRTGDTIMILATHHLGFARDGADQIIFMDKGRIVEQGEAVRILSNPSHPRTQAFVAAARLA